MIKAEVNNKHCQVEATGSMSELCSDLTAIFHGMIAGMHDEDAKDMFKKCFTMGFDDGIVLGVGKKEMDKIRMYNSHARELRDTKLPDAIDALLELMNGLKKSLSKLEDDSDEAE